MLLPSGHSFKCHEEVLYLQPMIPAKRFDIFFPLTRGCSEGLGAFWFFCKTPLSHDNTTESRELQREQEKTQQQKKKKRQKARNNNKIHMPEKNKRKALDRESLV